MAVEDLLRTAGFQAVAVRNDRAAYLALDEHWREFDALVVDVDLGEGTTGFDVARYARNLDPLMPVIFLSGGSPEWVTAFGVSGAVLVAKPFEDAHLVATLNRVTGGPGTDAPRIVPLAS